MRRMTFEYASTSTWLTARVGTMASVQGRCEAFTRESFPLHWTEDVAVGSPSFTGG